MTATSNGLRMTMGPHLPMLRRYARALTGSAAMGDTYVRATLEALLASPAAIAAGSAPRVELFRLFHAFWNAVAPLSDVESNERRADMRAGAQQLDALPGHRRAALLLNAVEGFSISDVATIMGQEPQPIMADIAAARAEIAAGMRSRVLIIEDEPMIAMHLESIIEDMGHTAIAIASTRSEAEAAFAENHPDLVLADIQLADGSSGLDAVRTILSDTSVPVVFITAYPERLLTGERPEPTWLVAKPFDPATVIATIGQALMLHQTDVVQHQAGS